MPAVLLFTLVILALVTVATVAPILVRLRISFLEEHFERWVLFIRIVSLGLAVVLFLLGVASAL